MEEEVGVEPSNITAAALPVPVFMKYDFVEPSGNVVWILHVDAEEQPPPPALETVVLSGSRPRCLTTAGSNFMVNDESRRI